MSEQATKGDIEKLVTQFAERFDTIDQQLSKIDTKLGYTVKEVAELRNIYRIRK